MNKARREKLKKASSLVGDAIVIIEHVQDDERDSLDNIPENLQGSEKYLSMEEALDNLGDALDSLTEASEYIEKAGCQ